MAVLTDEQKAAEGEVENKDEQILYPKSDEQKEADEKAAAEKKLADEGKTEEEIAAEKKVADEKIAADKVAADKAADEAKKTEVEVLVKAEDLKFPEGIKVNEAIQEKFLTIVNDKEMKPAEKAQAMIELQQDLYTVQAEAHQEQISKWEKEVASDVKFVGDTGDKLDENLAIAKKGMDALKVEGLAKLLEDTGFGSHPLFVEAFMIIGKAVSEDAFIVGGKGGSTEVKTQAQILYGSPEKK